MENKNKEVVRFLSNLKETCPMCGCENLTFGDWHLSGEEVSYEWVCPECGANGQEFYILKFDGHCVYYGDCLVNVNDYINPQEKE